MFTILGKDAKDSHLTNVGWYQDTGSEFNTFTEANLGYTARKEMIAESKTVNLLGYLHCPIFNLDKLILNGVEMIVRLLPSKNSFQFVGEVNVKLQIIDAYLKVRKVKVSSDTIVGHANALAKNYNAKYPITRTEVI